MVYAHTGLAPETAINPDEAVALGAAVQAAIIAGEPLEAILVDVTPHSLGIEVADWEFGVLVPDRYSVLIPRNTTIPTMRSEVYSALTPSQTAIRLKIYQGEHHVASRNTLLGEFMFDELRPEVAGQPPRITVQFDCDLDGIVHVSAVDRGSGKQARTTVTAARAHLSPAEIASTRAELETLPWEDEDEEAEHDEEELEEATATAAVPGGTGLSPEMAVLLARARRVVARGTGDTAALEAAIAALEAAARRGDEAAVVEHEEALLDLLYNVDET
jgi:molecular chaperone DnaK